ncbi:hypothetical protein HGM15179_011358 [Zosterops borbonicus]|uniref:Uncharacterized protein n=1 Tax=Zosterops borbonicus TaxID=364589 RepID=A0A8K1GD16_9PASS|nr:hypothetical protein HGM15179_011358 [Zosterops borbonicus]
MSQRPKSQYMKSNFEFRKDPTHAKKFYQIVPQKRCVPVSSVLVMPVLEEAKLFPKFSSSFQASQSQ